MSIIINAEETANPSIEEGTKPMDAIDENINKGDDSEVMSDSPIDKLEPESEVAAVPETKLADSGVASEPKNGDDSVNGTETENTAIDFDAKGTLEQIKSLLEELNHALENGQLKQCISLHEQCQVRLKKLKDVEYKLSSLKNFEKKLNKVQFEIQQLKKWRNWGMNQAREELVEKLIALKDSKEHPRDLHTKLKAILDQWNKWNKSGDFPNNKLREKFSQAYNEAFEPCKEFYKVQKKQRNANKKMRKNICAELDAFFESIDWTRNPDWRLIGETIRQARKQWKKAVPLNRGDWDSTNARFDQVMDKFQPYLEREREKGVLIREELIKKANALDSEPIRVAIEKAKSFQSEWNSVTIRTRKKKESELWEEFKSACDRQFQRRNDLRKEKDRRQQESKVERQKLLNELTKINQSPVSEIKEYKSQFTSIHQRWKQTDGPTKGKKSALESEFSNEIFKFKQLLKQANEIETSRLFSVLEQKAEICNELEQSFDTDNVEATVDANREKWNSIVETCGEHEDAIQSRFKSACQLLQDGKGSNDNHTEQSDTNYERKKKICLQLEVLAEITSPPEYARERMQYNVERLNAVMTKQTEKSNPTIEINNLLVEYWLTGAVPKQHHHSITERFDRIRSNLNKS